MLAALAATLWYYDAYLRPKIAYFSHYVTRHGVPEGRGELNPAEVGKRSISYRITRCAGRVEQVEVVNGLGRFTTMSSEGAVLGHNRNSSGADRECRYLYQRKADGSLDKEMAFDQFGNLLWTLQFNTPTTANYVNSLGYSNPRTASGRRISVMFARLRATPRRSTTSTRSALRFPTTRECTASDSSPIRTAARCVRAF